MMPPSAHPAVVAPSSQNVAKLRINPRRSSGSMQRQKHAALTDALSPRLANVKFDCSFNASIIFGPLFCPLTKTAKEKNSVNS